MRFLLLALATLVSATGYAHADTFSYFYLQNDFVIFNGQKVNRQVTFTYNSPVLITGLATFTPTTCTGPGNATVGYETCGLVEVELDPAYNDYVKVNLTPLPGNADVIVPGQIPKVVSPYDLNVESAGVTGSFAPGFQYSYTNYMVAATRFSMTETLSSTPEPSSLLLLATGVFGIAGVLRKRLVV